MFAFLSLALLASIGLSSAETGYSTTEYVGTFNGATYKGSSCKVIGFLDPLVSGSNECTPCPVGMYIGVKGKTCRSYCKEYVENPVSKVKQCIVNGRKSIKKEFTGLWTSADGTQKDLNSCKRLDQITPSTGNQCISCGKLSYKKNKNVCAHPKPIVA